MNLTSTFKIKTQMNTNMSLKNFLHLYITRHPVNFVPLAMVHLDRCVFPCLCPLIRYDNLSKMVTNMANVTNAINMYYYMAFDLHLTLIINYVHSYFECECHTNDDRTNATIAIK